MFCGCKGLCPYCGVNLNNEECQCTDEDRQPIDNRLRILKDFYANRIGGVITMAVPKKNFQSEKG